MRAFWYITLPRNFKPSAQITHQMLVKLLREGLGRLIVLGDILTRSTPISRSAESQAKVAAATSNLAIYQFYACPFCVKTRRVVKRLNLPIEYRDALNNPDFRTELESKGGKIKVPCLKIDKPGENGINAQWMYESNDIIAYLEQRFGKSV